MVVAETKRAGDGRRRSGRGRIRRAAVRRPLRRGAQAGRAGGVGRDCPTTCWSRPAFGDKAATDRAFAASRPCREARLQHRPRHRRADGAALRRSRDYDAATGRYTLYAGSGGAVRQKSELAAGARHPARQAARAFLRRRRQFRHAQPAFRRVRPGAVGVEASSAAPVKYTATRSEAFLTDYQGRDLVTKVELALRKDGKIPGDARRQHQQRRRALRVALAAVEGLGPDHRLLRHSGGDAARARGVHQHHADQRLSLVGPAGGDLRDRAADRHGRRPSSASTASRCGARTSSSRRRCRTATPSACSTTAAPTRRTWTSRCDIADWKGFKQRKREAKKRGKLLGLGLAQLRRVLDRRAEGARRDHGAAGRPRRRRDRHAAERPGPRDELRAGGRRPDRACRSRRSTSSSATPTSSASAAARIPAARCATPPP